MEKIIKKIDQSGDDLKIEFELFRESTMPCLIIPRFQLVR